MNRLVTSGVRSAAGNTTGKPRAQLKLRKMVYFGGDATNPTLILRIRSFRRLGLEVVGFTFRRTKFNKEFRPFWPNIHLGPTSDRKYHLRVPAMIRGLVIVLRHREMLDDADVLYARMIDQALLALVARRVFRLKAKLVYEIEDVQAVFFRRTPVGALFRWLERLVLKGAELVVVMSPGFVRGYLAPTQGFFGPYYVLENRCQLEDTLPVEADREPRPHWRAIRDRWVIGWFGTIRCVKSMRILSEIAERMGERVLIYTRGFPTETGLQAYGEYVRRHPNWVYDGEYAMPRDLPEMYNRVHFSWCLDFLDEGGNSELLLACRMYQGGYFGAVPLVTAQSEMARHLAPHQIGCAIEPPYAERICALLESLDWKAYESHRARILSLRDKLFLEDGSQHANLLETIAATPRRGRMVSAASPAGRVIPGR